MRVSEISCKVQDSYSEAGKLVCRRKQDFWLAKQEVEGLLLENSHPFLKIIFS